MSIFSAVLGFVVFVTLVVFAFRAHTSRWRAMSRDYVTPWPKQFVAQKRIESIIVLGGAMLWTQYLVALRVTDEGLALRLLPFYFVTPTVLFPFTELKAAPSDWYLNKETWELTVARAPGFRMMVDKDLLDWIRQHSKEWKH